MWVSDAMRCDALLWRCVLPTTLVVAMVQSQFPENPSPNGVLFYDFLLKMVSDQSETRTEQREKCLEKKIKFVGTQRQQSAV